MQKLNLKNVTQYVEENIGQFHSARLEKVVNIELKKVDHDLGFSLHDYQDPYNTSSSPLIVERQLVPGDVAQLYGSIPPG